MDESSVSNLRLSALRAETIEPAVVESTLDRNDLLSELLMPKTANKEWLSHVSGAPKKVPCNTELGDLVIKITEYAQHGRRDGLPSPPLIIGLLWDLLYVGVFRLEPLREMNRFMGRIEQSGSLGLVLKCALARYHVEHQMPLSVNALAALASVEETEAYEHFDVGIVSDWPKVERWLADRNVGGFATPSGTTR